MITLALAVCLASGCRAYPPGTPIPDVLDEVNATLRPNVILLQPGDSIVVKADNEKISQTTLIRPDGRAMFPLLGELEIAGLTVKEVEETLSRLYEAEVNKADLFVRAGTLGQRQIVFAGSVGGNTTLPVQPYMTMDLVESLARMGVPKDTFTLVDAMILIRWMPDEGRRRHWVIDASPEYWTNPEKLFLQANDIIYIPNAPIVDVSAWVREWVKVIPLPYVFTAQRL